MGTINIETIRQAVGDFTKAMNADDVRNNAGQEARFFNYMGDVSIRFVEKGAALRHNELTSGDLRRLIEQSMNPDAAKAFLQNFNRQHGNIFDFTFKPLNLRTVRQVISDYDVWSTLHQEGSLSQFSNALTAGGMRQEEMLQALGKLRYDTDGREPVLSKRDIDDLRQTLKDLKSIGELTGNQLVLPNEPPKTSGERKSYAEIQKNIASLESVVSRLSDFSSRLVECLNAGKIDGRECPFYDVTAVLSNLQETSQRLALDLERLPYDLAQLGDGERTVNHALTGGASRGAEGERATLQAVKQMQKISEAVDEIVDPTVDEVKNPPGDKDVKLGKIVKDGPQLMANLLTEAKQLMAAVDGEESGISPHARMLLRNQLGLTIRMLEKHAEAIATLNAGNNPLPEGAEAATAQDFFRRGILKKVFDGKLDVLAYIQLCQVKYPEEMIAQDFSGEGFTFNASKKVSGGRSQVKVLRRQQVSGDGTVSYLFTKNAESVDKMMPHYYLGVLNSRSSGTHLSAAKNIYATHKAATELGCGGSMVQSKMVIVEDEPAFAMEEALGDEGAVVRDKLQGTLTAQKEKGTVHQLNSIGSLMGESNRIDWCDWFTGQGDRHLENFKIQCGDDGRWTIKGIDNDMSFFANRIGLMKFRFANRSVLKTRLTRCSKEFPALFPALKKMTGNEIDKLVEKVTTKAENGEVCVLDLEKLSASRPFSVGGKTVGKQVFYELAKALGLNNARKPSFITSGMLAKINSVHNSVKAGAPHPFYDKFKGILSNDQIAAAILRFDEMYEHAQALARAGLVLQENVHTDEETPDYDKANLEKIQQAIEDARDVKLKNHHGSGNDRVINGTPLTVAEIFCDSYTALTAKVFDMKSRIQGLKDSDLSVETRLKKYDKMLGKSSLGSLNEMFLVGKSRNVALQILELLDFSHKDFTPERKKDLLSKLPDAVAALRRKGFVQPLSRMKLCEVFSIPPPANIDKLDVSAFTGQFLSGGVKKG